MSESYRNPQSIIRPALRSEPGKIALWASIADGIDGVSARVFDLTVPEERAAAMGAFEVGQPHNKLPGEAIVQIAEQNGEGVIQLSGTPKELSEFWSAVNANQAE
jgi:hypothetical protein